MYLAHVGFLSWSCYIIRVIEFISGYQCVDVTEDCRLWSHMKYAGCFWQVAYVSSWNRHKLPLHTILGSDVDTAAKHCHVVGKVSHRNLHKHRALQWQLSAKQPGALLLECVQSTSQLKI